MSETPSAHPGEVSALAVVRAIYAAVAAGDLRALGALIHPDVVAVQAASLPGFGGVWRGAEAFAAMADSLLAAFPGFAVAPEAFFLASDAPDGGNTVLVLTRVSAAGDPAAGRPALDQPMIELWRVRDGRAVHCRPFYFDAAAAALSAARSATPSTPPPGRQP